MPLQVIHQPINFGDQRHCGSGDITVLLCHIILQDTKRYLWLSQNQKVKQLYGWKPFDAIHHPAKFGGLRHSGDGDIFLVCHIISHKHLIKLSHAFKGGSPSW